MSVFLLWWTVGCSLYSAIAATIATGSLATQSFKFLPVAVVIYWILLGIVEWTLLSPHLSGAYQWGMLTIIGGIVSSFLLAFAAVFILSFLFRDFSPVDFGGGSNPSSLDYLISLISSIFCLFATGLLVGWGQNLILQNSLSQINKGLPLVTGITWLIGTIP